MKKIPNLLLIMLSLFIITKNVRAEDNISLSKIRINNAYAVYDGLDRVHLFYAEKYSLNGNISYCIEPGIAMNTNIYSSTDDLTISGLDNSILEDVKLLAYYGFGYKNNLSDKYYMATQELIWDKITKRNTYWVSEEDTNGNKINIENEKQTIKSLVDKHYIKPSFNNLEYVVLPNFSIILNDNNKVLSDYEIYSSNISNVSISDNKLIISPSINDKSGEIELRRKNYSNKVSLIYYNGNNQKLISSGGALSPVTAKIKINVEYTPKIKVVKVDSDTNEIIRQAGIKFKIKNTVTGSYICENEECIYETDSSGSFKTNKSLNYGTYQIEEIDQYIKNYKWNNQPLSFTIDENSDYIKNGNYLYLEFKFKNNPIKGKININKVGEKPIFKDNKIEYIEYNLDNVIINLYANDVIYDNQENQVYKKGDLLSPIKVVNGFATIDNLYLGSYCLIEALTSDNHILNKEPYCFEIKQEDSLTNQIVVNIKLNNYLPKGTFEFTKYDSETNIPLPNTFIEIYTIDNKLVYSGSTDEDGKIIIDNLPYGKYYYQETQAPSGYMLDNEKYNFEIKENDEIVKTDMINELINVPSTSLNKSSMFILIPLILLLNGLNIIRYGKKSKN